MSNWLPAKGELFYVQCLRVYHTEVHNDFGMTVSVVKNHDRSYHSNIFRMVASDDTTIVGDIVHGLSIGEPRRVMLRNEFKVLPVGPDVAEALGLQNESTED